MTSDVKMDEGLLKEFSLISFDFFDTLSQRPYCEPVELFSHMEVVLGVPGFMEARVEAECKAIKNSLYEEVCLTEIYGEIDDGFRHLISKEVELEINSNFRVESNVSLYLKAIASSARVVIVSDTYLDHEFFKKALVKLKMPMPDDLLISSDLRRTKRTGSMFEELLRRYSLQGAADKILHIGDNYHSDFKVPKKLGIKSLLVERTVSKITRSNSQIRRAYDYKEFLDEEVQLNISRNIKLASLCDYTKYWEIMGFCFAGPMIYDFCKWIKKECHKNNKCKIIFVARDGYLLQKCFSLIDPTFETHYLHLSRQPIKKIKQDVKKSNEFQSFLDTNGLKTEQVAIVDVGTCNFTSQKFLSDYIDDILGLYWVVGGKGEGISFESFFKPVKDQDFQFLGSSLIEFFMSSPESPIEDVEILKDKLVPVFKRNISKYEQIRKDKILEMEKPILRFCHMVEESLGQVEFPLTAEAVVEWNKVWMEFPSLKDVFYFRVIKHAVDDFHSKYVNQINLGQKFIKRILWSQ